MSLTLDSIIKDIKKDPAAVELIDKIIPGFATNPQMKLVGGMTFKKLAKIQPAKVTPEKLEAIEQALSSLG
ncbi:MAG: hypothetical protein FWG24_02125 [Eggerthellaceae bacterium]|nr:hypothetical protein [Eggerthellaceae bacterium]MDR2721849.1 hypothetical protein [Coriobacteriaceae bacterium]